MGHDKADSKDVQERKETKESQGEMTEQVEKAYTKGALSSLQSDKVTQFADSKIDKVEKIDGKPVTPKEREAMKDIAEAIAKGDMDSLRKTVDGLDEKTAKRVAAGLDEAFRGTGIDVHYDGNKGDGMHPNIEIITGDKKVMIPLDGGAPQVGRKEDFYSRPESERAPHIDKDATSKDLAAACKALKEAQAKDEKRKASMGLR